MSVRNRRPSRAATDGFMRILDELKKEKHITESEYASGQALASCMSAFWGSSTGLVGQLSDKVDMSIQPRCWPPGGVYGSDSDIVGQALKRLRDHEQRTLRFCLLHRELPRGRLTDFGRMNFPGLKTAKTQRSAAIGMFCSLVRTVHELMAQVTATPHVRSGSQLDPYRLLEDGLTFGPN